MPRHVHAALAEAVVMHDLTATSELILIRAVLTVAIAGGIAITILAVAGLLLGRWIIRRIRAHTAPSWVYTPLRVARCARIRRRRRREYETVA